MSLALAFTTISVFLHLGFVAIFALRHIGEPQEKYKRTPARVVFDTDGTIKVNLLMFINFLKLFS